MNSTSLVYCSSEITQDLVYLIDPFTTLSYILAKEGVVKMNLIIILKKRVFITKINEKKNEETIMYIFIEWSIFRILAFLANTQRAVNKREAFPVFRSRDY